MCWKRKPPPITEVLPHVKRRIITFGKNLYGGQDLRGCWNDSLNLSAKVTGMFTDFDVRKFRDYDVTANRYLSEAAGGVAMLSPGATVLVMADSCHSATITRGFGLGLMDIKHPTRNRFYDTGLAPRKTVDRIFKVAEMNHIVMSGCLANGTSADAFINGKYYGAFTFFAVMTLRPGMTYKEWFSEIRKYLPSQDFEQTPTLEGPEYLLNRKVFEDQTLILHNSSHGSFVYDSSGDEGGGMSKGAYAYSAYIHDGQDETIYFDRHVLDDEIGAVLNKIPI